MLGILFPGVENVSDPLLFPLWSLNQGPSFLEAQYLWLIMVMLPGKLPSAFILAAKFMCPWTWIFLVTRMIEHGCLSLCDWWGRGFQFSMSAISPVGWWRGLEWQGCEPGSHPDSTVLASWSSYLSLYEAQFFSCQLGTVTSSCFHERKPFGKCTVAQTEGGQMWANHRCSIDDTTVWRAFANDVGIVFIIQC